MGQSVDLDVLIILYLYYTGFKMGASMKKFLIVSLLCMIQLYADEAGIAMGLAGEPESIGQDIQDNDVEIPHTKHPHPHHHHEDAQDSDDQRHNSIVVHDGKSDLNTAYSYDTHLHSTFQDITQTDDATLLLQFRPQFNDGVLIIPLQHYDNEEDDTIDRHIFSVSIIRDYIEKNITQDPLGRKFTLRLRKMLRFFSVGHTVREDAIESDSFDMMEDDIHKVSDLLHNLSDWLAWNVKPMVAYDPEAREIRMVSLNGNRFTVPIDFLAMGPEGLQDQVFELYLRVERRSSSSDRSIQKYAKTVEGQSESSVNRKQSQELARVVRYYENKYKSNSQFIDNLFENTFKLKSAGFVFQDKIKMLVRVDKLTSVI